MADSKKVTLSTLNTRTGVKKQSHSSYWLDDVMDEWEDADDPNTIDKAIRLAAVRRAVSNFVRILTNDPKIAVKFNEGKDSYTDGKTVVISAQDKPKDFDVMVGLALHEASHCLLTPMNFYAGMCSPLLMIGDYNFIGFWKDKNNKEGIADFFHPDFRKIIASDDEGVFKSLMSHIKMFLNIVEDRRIDAWVYNTAVGYRPYYAALYKKYFLAPVIDKALASDTEWKEPTMDNYINRIVNVMNSHNDPDALPHLRQMFDTFDVSNIHRLSDYSPNIQMKKFIREVTLATEYVADSRNYNRRHGVTNRPQGDVQYILDVFTNPDQRAMKGYEYMPPTWILANELLAQVVKATDFKFDAEVPPPTTTKVRVVSEGEGDGDPVEGEVDIDTQPSESKDDGGKPVGKPLSAERLKKAVAAQRKFLEGDLRKTKIARKLGEMVSQVEEANAEIVEVGGKTSAMGKIRTPCIVINNVTKQTMMADWFLFGPSGRADVDFVRRNNDQFIKSGIRMGQILSQRLAIRNDPTVTHYTRQDAGRIDRRILAQLGMNITNVFKKTRTDKFNPVVVYLSLDASGSMSGRKWGKALAVATALSYLADKVPDIDVVVMARGGSDVATVAVLHDSRKQKFAVARGIFELTTACGATPEALCFEATLDFIVNSEKKSDVYFINFSDGEPSFSMKNHNPTDENSHYTSYCGTTAETHCRQIMNVYREAGVRILSYFISEFNPMSDYAMKHGSGRAFRAMYGESAEFVNVENATMVLKTLQKLLSDRSSMDSTYS